MKPAHTFKLGLLTIIIVLLCGVNSCKPVKTNNKDINTESIITQPQQVSVSLLQKTNFPQQIISTGILHAVHNAQLRFSTSGEITFVNIKNGDIVKKGMLIAQLENKKQKLNIERANQEVEAAKIELSSQLLGFGGTEDDTTSVNSNLLHSLKIQSGYNNALLNLKQATLEYQNTLLLAPFEGVITNLELQANTYISQADVFCILMDNSQFYVNFQLLESEIDKVKLGQTIIASPMVSTSVNLKGRVSEINPVIDKNGLFKVKALLVSKPSLINQLFDGMNMKVVLEKVITNQLVVPKQAVVKRSNKNVVFTLENGLSKWNYVTITGENSSNYIIGDGLNNGDTIIIGGNINLAHDAQVVVIQANKQH